MPLGLSYYTFSSITYLVDVYQGKLPAEKDFVDLALFLSFCPKITAGPIAKAGEFLPQLKRYPGIRRDNVEAGVQIFVIGLFKKIVLADHLKVFVDDVFWAPTAYHSATVILAVISYSLQIYLDFAGYSDMAIGVARTMGIELPANFNFPYLASNISEFWKRWHISLSSFLREYVYYPLGGSRRGSGRTYVNLMLVMLISGAWHGNGVTFLVWGFLHGCASCVHRAFRGKFPQGKVTRAMGVVWNFVVVSLFWVFFRATDLENAAAVIKGIFVYQDGISQPYLWSFFAMFVCLVAACVGYTKGKTGWYPVQKLESVKTWTLFLTFTGLTVMLGYYGNTAFIYGGF
jgi:alginate O-acetyltransferase complex protein AlgI